MELYDVFTGIIGADEFIGENISVENVMNYAEFGLNMRLTHSEAELISRSIMEYMDCPPFDSNDYWHRFQEPLLKSIENAPTDRASLHDIFESEIKEAKKLGYDASADINSIADLYKTQREAESAVKELFDSIDWERS